LATLKRAALAPIPSAIVIATTAVNSGLRRRARTAYKASRVSNSACLNRRLRPDHLLEIRIAE
jgi:hypothetical protein